LQRGTLNTVDVVRSFENHSHNTFSASYASSDKNPVLETEPSYCSVAMSAEEVARREFFRVSVPEAEYIPFETDIGTFRVLEISERGIKLDSDQELNLEQWLRGKILFDEDQSFKVSSQVIRVSQSDQPNHWAVVAKAMNLPMSRVVAFQSYLVRTYGPSPENEN